MGASSSYDVVVVGAGPGGAATATHLARGGARVLLLDRSSFPRDKACGGGLTPRGVAAIDRLKIDLGERDALRVGGLEMVGYGRSLTAPFPATSTWPSHGLVTRRSVIDNKIVEAAVDAGAELRTGVRVVGPLFTDGVCRGVRAKSGGSTEDIEAVWTIAADGATSATARAAGLAPNTTGPSGGGFWYAALRGYFGPVEPRLGADGQPLLEFYPLRTARGRWLPAYAWVFPLPDGTANVGVDLPHTPSLDACPDLRPAYDDFVERMRRERPGFENAVQEAPPQGALLPEAMAGFRAATSGMLAVGDAAGLITPYSGEGILYALESAELAAGAILQARSSAEAARGYAKAIRDGYGFQLSSALRIMKAMRKAPLAAVAAAVGFRSERALKAGVRVMAYLIEDAPTESTVSKGYAFGRRLWQRLSSSRPVGH
jgi:geranylgeranyl reductase family protein